MLGWGLLVLRHTVGGRRFAVNAGNNLSSEWKWSLI